MRPHTVDYLAQDGRRPTARQRVSRGFWLRNVPRLLLICSLAGHKPVVDGTEGFRDQPGHRWVACARCGVRPDAQGNLDPARWDIGRPYTGAWTDQSDHGITTKGAPVDPDNTSPDRERTWTVPGPWPAKQTGTIGGQLVIGTNQPERIGFSVKVGNMGSEHTLAADVSLPYVGALYLHTENFGRGLQRRLNPTGYESKVVELGLNAYDHALRWRLWANRNERAKDTPAWRDGSISLDLAERAFGPKRYSYTIQGRPVMGLVRMPEGDDHQVRLTLKKQTLSRPRPAGRQPLEEKWTVDWQTRTGIPVRTHSYKSGTTNGGTVYVSDDSVRHDRWVLEACATIATKIAADRTRYRWKPTAPATARPKNEHFIDMSRQRPIADRYAWAVDQCLEASLQDVSHILVSASDDTAPGIIKLLRHTWVALQQQGEIPEGRDIWVSTPAELRLTELPSDSTSGSTKHILRDLGLDVRAAFLAQQMGPSIRDLGPLFTLPDGYIAPDTPGGHGITLEDFQSGRPDFTAKFSVLVDGEYVPVEGIGKVTVGPGEAVNIVGVVPERRPWNSYVIDPATVGTIADPGLWARQQCAAAMEQGADQILVYTNDGGDILHGLITSTWARMTSEGLTSPHSDNMIITAYVRTRTRPTQADASAEEPAQPEPSE